MNLGNVKKKDTVRISTKDLSRLLAEHEQMSNHVTELQERLGQLLEENRQLKAAVPPPPEDEPIVEYPPSPTVQDPFDTFGPDVYIDGASKFRNDYFQGK